MTWEFNEDEASSLLINLAKQNGSQETRLVVPEFITEADVKQSWECQGEDWLKLAAKDEPEIQGIVPQIYFGSRILHFARHEVGLLWSLLHFDQIPKDLFGFLPMELQLLNRIRERGVY